MSKMLLFKSALAAALLAASTAAAAQAEPYVPDGVAEPSAGAMAFDLIVVRPVSLVATILGSGLFVLQLPLSAVQGKPPLEPAKKLVMEPARYTFDRPLGHME